MTRDLAFLDTLRAAVGWRSPVAATLRVDGVVQAAGAAVIPQGGNTGLVGGSVPRGVADGPQVVVSTLRLRDLEPVDTLAGEVTVGAARRPRVRGDRAPRREGALSRRDR